jgi:multiple sugar transport system substrate-binding protein
VGNTAYLLPYGILPARALSTTKAVPAGRRDAPPKTLDEFLQVSKKISALPGKYGYCLRGGQGGRERLDDLSVP